MFTLSNALKNVRRHLRKSILYFLICVVAVLTLQIYIAGIDRNEVQLFQLPDALPISATVANLDGSSFTGLQIREQTVDGLQSSNYVRDLQLTVSLQTGVDDFPGVYAENQRLSVEGANTLAALEGLEPDAVTWLPSYGPDFLGGDEAVCVASSMVMGISGWSLGDSIPLDLYNFRFDNSGAVFYDELGLMEARIVGVADLNMAATAPTFVIPFETARAAFRNHGVEFTASSATFYVRAPLKLNDFKAEMKTLLLYQAVTDGSAAMSVLANQGVSLLVNDAAFISAATRLQETLSLLRGFLPLIAVVLAAVGYLVAYLMIQNRREEFAVLRMLGLSKGAGMGLYFTEMAILTLSGSLLGVVISTAFGIGGFDVGVLMFFLSFMLGSVIALIRLGRTNVMLALAQPD